MGLDMYLFSAPKVDGMLAEDYVAADEIIRDKQRLKNEIASGTIVWGQYLELDKDRVRELQPLITKGHIENFDGFLYGTLLKEIAYWRKANQIHNWFVENLQDGIDECQLTIVDEDSLRELLEVCKEVFEKKNTDFSEENLPTASGFFFGDVDYDECYYSDVEFTIAELEEILKNTDFDKEVIFYQSSW